MVPIIFGNPSTCFMPNFVREGVSRDFRWANNVRSHLVSGFGVIVRWYVWGLGFTVLGSFLSYSKLRARRFRFRVRGLGFRVGRKLSKVEGLRLLGLGFRGCVVVRCRAGLGFVQGLRNPGKFPESRCSPKRCVTASSGQGDYLQ